MFFLISHPFWISQICKQELKIIWYPKTQVVTPTLLRLEADIDAMYQINLWSRTANKVYIVLREEVTNTFDELFESIRSVERSKYIAPNQQLLINADSVKSQLSHLPSIQSIAKKAVINSLVWDENWDESWPSAYITISIIDNQCIILLNTTGEWLHRRWYRTETGEAPIKENLAAALIIDAQRKFSTPFVDPCCGSWTFLIEAAMIAKNIAPWLNRIFAHQDLIIWDKLMMREFRSAAKAKIRTDKEHLIVWWDSDPLVLVAARNNAHTAWVSDYIAFENCDCRELHEKIGWSVWTMVTNPPYGARMNPDNIAQTYDDILWFFEDERNWWIITSWTWFETITNPDLRKVKQLYNGPDKVWWWRVG